MSESADEAKLARIEKYKEARRKQLSAKTAALLYSDKVTNRRPRKAKGSATEESPLKSSSDQNVNSPSSVRTTRTSRLRAAAATHTDTTQKRQTLRSSSVTSLTENKNRSPRNSRVVERDKPKPRRSSRGEKENLKNVTSYEGDIGAITKPIHSIAKANLDKEKKNTSPKERKDVKSVSLDRKTKISSKKDFSGPVLNGIDKQGSITKNKIDSKYTLEDNKKNFTLNTQEVPNLDEYEKLNIRTVKDVVPSSEASSAITKKLKPVAEVNPEIIKRAKPIAEVNPAIKETVNPTADVIEKVNPIADLNPAIIERVISTADPNPIIIEKLNPTAEFSPAIAVVKTIAEINPVIIEDVKPSSSGLPEDDGSSVLIDDVGLFGAVCVRKVERFSELLSNLCSPYEADVLFEDILTEEDNDTRIVAQSSCAQQPLCRRTATKQATTAVVSPKRATLTANSDNATETASKPNSRSLKESPHKTESSLPSSKISPKSIVNLSNAPKTNKLVKSSYFNQSSKTPERKQSSDGSKSSHIPVSQKSAEKLSRKSVSPLKQETKITAKFLYHNNKKDNTSDKQTSTGENKKGKKQRAQKNSDSASDKYHYSNKRLTSLENDSPEIANDVQQNLSANLLSNDQDSNSKLVNGEVIASNQIDEMSILHEPLRNHSDTSRLSQKMDSLAALTKQAIDRVNKLNNLHGNKLHTNSSDAQLDEVLNSSAHHRDPTKRFDLINENTFHQRGVTERLRDIDTAAQRLIDFEKQSAMFSDLNHDISSQNCRPDNSLPTFSHTPVSILKRKSIHEDVAAMSNVPSHAISSPPVTFSPSVIETHNASRQRQGILKKRRSLDESQVARRRSCSPEVSFADDGTSDSNKPILKNRRSSLEDVVRTHSPEGHIQGILKRKMSREEDYIADDLSHGSPEPQGILKRKSNSSSSSSTTSSHVSIAQAVLLAAAGGAEIVDDDRDIVRPILKKKSFSEERPSPEIQHCDTPKPILKKKSLEHDEYEYDLPKKPILKISKRLPNDDGHASSFDLSEDDRSSRRPSLLRSRTSDHSGSECEATVRPILKQRGSSLTRERSQSPRPRLSFYADNDANICVANFSSDANETPAVGCQRNRNIDTDPEESANSNYPSAVLRRRNLRPKNSLRSKSTASNLNDELLTILNNRRIKVEESCDSERVVNGSGDETLTSKTFPSIADRIKSMEQSMSKDAPNDRPSTSRSRVRDRDRYKTQPITVDEMWSVASSLEPGQAGFQAYDHNSGSFPSHPVESGATVYPKDLFVPEKEPCTEFTRNLDSARYVANCFVAKPSPAFANNVDEKDDNCEATFLDRGSRLTAERRQSALDDIEKEVDKVRVALDEDSRALDEDERNQAEADNWSLNVSCDSGVYNRVSSRDSGPHSGEELGALESQEIQDNHASNSSVNDWSAVGRDLINMDRERKSTEVEMPKSGDERSDDEDHSGFALGLVKSNSVVARASMWQALQQQAKGTPKPLVRHNRSRNNSRDSATSDRFKTQPISYNASAEANSPPKESFSLAQSKSSANVLDRDEDAKLDEDDPAKLTLMEKMKMFNSKLAHKPPVAGLPKKEEKLPKNNRRTMPVLASQVQEAMSQNERMSKSYTTDVPRNRNFAMKMELFRSASAKNTSLAHIMKENAKFRSLDLDDDLSAPDQTFVSDNRGAFKTAQTTLQNVNKSLAKGSSSEGLKDEGIDSSSDDESISSVSSSCSSSESSDELQGSKPRRFQQRKAKIKPSRTESDISKYLPGKIQLPGANELKERLVQAKNTEIKLPELGKLRRTTEVKEIPKPQKLAQPIQLGKLRRQEKPVQNEVKTEPVLKISTMNQEAKNKFFGIEPKKEKTIDELAARVRKYIPPVSKSVSTHTFEVAGSGSDGESSGGREVRQITTRGRHRFAGGGVQRSATHAEMPHRGGTIAERLAALQAAGANDWRARVCRLSPETEDSKAIERAKNRINDSLNCGVDEKKKVQIDGNELSSNILADRRNKLETASQGWRKRVPATDASLFTVAGRVERDLVSPPPVSSPAAAPASPGIPTALKFRSRKQPSPPNNGFGSGPLRSASCAVVNSQTSVEKIPELAPIKHDRESFKRSHSVSETICQVDKKESAAPECTRVGAVVAVPRADDETFTAFFTPALVPHASDSHMTGAHTTTAELDLDAIDSSGRHLLSTEWARRAKRDRRHAASRNPLKALAARTDLRAEYTAPPNTFKELYIKEKVKANCGLAAEALAALATKEDFANVALRSAAAAPAPSHGTKPLMLLHVKGRRRVQTRLVEPVHTNVNRGDCFVLVTPDQVFLYLGLYCNVIERNRSTDIALHIHNTKDLGCKNSTSVFTIDEQSKSYNNRHWNTFWSLLGVREDIEQYKPAETGHPEEDEIYESCMVQTNMSYEVMDDELVPIKDYWGQQPKIAMLHQSKTIVFDFGSEMYIWYGKNVPLETRRRAAQLAHELFDEGYNYEDCHVNPLNAAAYQGARANNATTEKISKTRPEWAIFSKVTQHMETILFKEKFLDWPDYTRVIKIKPQENKSTSTEITPCDAETMWKKPYEDPDLILEGSHVGRGTQYYDKIDMRHYEIKTRSVCKWLISEYDFQKVENETQINDFFSADSYIIRWEYQINTIGRELNGKPSKHNITGRDRCAYFCWQGKDASPNEKGAAALLTVELDREKGPQIRVAQGSEQPAFLNLFQGNLIIHQGKKDLDKSRYRLFITRGNLSNEAYLLQVPCSVRQLRSRGSLLLVDTEKGVLYIWHGSRSLKHTKNIAIELANKLIARKSSYLFGDKVSDIKITEVKEGEEPKEFLEALGSNKQYYNSVLSAGRDVGSDVTARLFHFTDLGGQFEAYEVLSPLRHEHLVTPYPFEQKEMYSASQPALFLLDDGKSVWVWQGWWPRGEDGELEPAERNAGVGAFAARWQGLRAATLRTAQAYLEVSRADRSGRDDVKVVAAGLEPTEFTELFDTWIECDEAADANIAHGHKAGAILSGACELSRLSCCDAILPLAELQRRPLPEHVDPHHLERHLSTSDFLEAFGITKEEFSVLPAWKQTNMKKEVGLF